MGRRKRNSPPAPESELVEFKSYVTCQWQHSDRVTIHYLVYRYTLALWSLAVGLASFFTPQCSEDPRFYNDDEPRWKWFIYLTNWGYLLLAVQALLGLYLVQRAFCSQRSSANKSIILKADYESNMGLTQKPSKEQEADIVEEETPRIANWLCIVYRVLFASAASLAFFITIVYWSLIHNPEIHAVDTLNVLVHGCNSAIMAAEIAVARHGVRPRDACGPLAVGFLYTVFSWSYYAGGGTDRLGRRFIYPDMDWSRWRSALLFSFESEVGVVATHGVTLLLQAARTLLHRRLASGKSDASADR